MHHYPIYEVNPPNGLGGVPRQTDTHTDRQTHTHTDTHTQRQTTRYFPTRTIPIHSVNEMNECKKKRKRKRNFPQK